MRWAANTEDSGVIVGILTKAGNGETDYGPKKFSPTKTGGESTEWGERGHKGGRGACLMSPGWRVTMGGKKGS